MHLESYNVVHVTIMLRPLSPNCSVHLQQKATDKETKRTS